jgi:hypothetical protein
MESRSLHSVFLRPLKFWESFDRNWDGFRNAPINFHLTWTIGENNDHSGLPCHEEST